MVKERVSNKGSWKHFFCSSEETWPTKPFWAGIDRRRNRCFSRQYLEELAFLIKQLFYSGLLAIKWYQLSATRLACRLAITSCPARPRRIIVKQTNPLVGEYALSNPRFSMSLDSTSVTLYVLLVRSHLTYASQVWAPTPLGSLNVMRTLTAVQRRATRYILRGLELDYKQRLLLKTQPFSSLLLSSVFRPPLSFSMYQWRNTSRHLWYNPVFSPFYTSWIHWARHSSHWRVHLYSLRVVFCSCLSSMECSSSGNPFLGADISY